MKVERYRNQNNTCDKIAITDINVEGAKIIADALQLYTNHISHYGGKNIHFVSLLNKQLKGALKE